MKKAYVFLLIMLSVVAFGSLSATVLLTDDFTGTIGQTISANGWTAHSGAGTTPITITSTGLTYSGYTGSGIGNTATTGGNGEDDNKAFTSTNTGSLYLSFVYYPTAASTTSDYSVMFSSQTGTTVTMFYGKLYVQRNASNLLRFGITKTTSTAVGYTDYIYPMNTAYLIIIRYDIVSGTTNDLAYLFVNPALGGSEPAATVAGLTDTAGDPVLIQSICLRQGANTASATYDGFRVGTTWADVAGASLAAQPTVQPSGIGFNTTTTTSFNVTYSAGSRTVDGYLAIRKAGSAPTTDPSDGVGYTIGNDLGDGVVAYSGPNLSFPDSELNPSTTYYYKIYAYNGSGGTSNYLITNPLQGNHATLVGVVVPTVTTAAITSIGVTSAAGGGEVTYDGGGTVDARGVCWATTTGPLATGNHSTDGSGLGVFTSSLTPLTANQLYYVRAYAHNSAGYAYGDEVTFTTLKAEPTAHVTAFAAGTTTSGTIPLTWVDAAGTDSYLIKGSSVSYASIVDPVDGVAESSGGLVRNVAQGAQAYTFIGLNPLTTYYFKIYPYNNSGTNTNYYTGGTVPQASATTLDITPAVYLEENFDYPINDLITAHGWTNHSGTSNFIPVVAPDLAYLNYPMSGGGGAYLTTTGEDANKTFTNQTSGTMYASLLINVTSSQTGGDYVFHFGTNPWTTGFFAKLYIKKDSATDNYAFGLTRNNVAGLVYTGFNYVPGTTYLVVLKYTFVEGTVNDEVKLFVNPSFPGTEPAADLTVSTTDPATDAVNIGGVALRQGSTSTAPICLIDGIRVANTWDMLLPEGGYIGDIVITGDIVPFTDAIVGTPTASQTYHLNSTSFEDFVDVQVDGPFKVWDTSAPFPSWESSLQLLPGFDYDIYVRYEPVEAGTQNGSITHTAAGGEAATVVIYLSGTAITPLPQLSVEPAVMSFSANSGETSAAQMATVTAANLTTSITVASAGEYTFSATESGTYSNPYTISTGYNGVNDFWVKYSPTSIGTFTSAIIVSSNSRVVGDTINVTGYGLDPNGDYATDLFISEYVEGTSFQKALEIFNGTGHSVDLAGYSLKKQTNGAGIFGSELVLSGTLPNNDVYVLALTSTTGTVIAGDFVDLYTNSQVVNFNGNDAVALYHYGVQTDVVGIVDQVANWGLDMTLVRMSNVDSPRTDFTWAEWTQYPVNTFTYLGSHTFTPGVLIADPPEILPAGGLQFAPINVTITSTTPSPEIWYTLDGTEPTNIAPSILYTGQFAVSTTTTVKAIVYALGYTPSTVTTVVYSYAVEVANIAALKALTPDTGAYYKLTGEVVLTLQSAAYYHTKYLQDDTDAIMIYDATPKITTAYNLGDGITGIIGQLHLFTGMLELLPAADPGAATSTGNVVTPVEVNLADLNATYAAKLVKINGVTTDSTGVWTASKNYVINDGIGAGIIRTQYSDLDYINTAIPVVAKNIVGVVLQYNLVTQFIPRSLAEFTDAALEAPVTTIYLEDGSVKLSWPDITGATGYKVYGSDDPYATFPGVGWTWITDPDFVTSPYTYTGTEGFKFFKVTAN